ncbi:hypothetical protein [Bellilinea sp.]|uniref:hypothetical protein n=1 Tax=Bellilinea sp. TaxID=2838785 RepID=UPI002ADE07AA|nr:hypothetical protein [Bellilinea sp.]
MKSWKKPTREQVDKAVALLVHAQQYRYFFNKLQNPEWLEPLREKEFFRHPPAPIRDEEKGTIRFPLWPEAQYLARVAQHKPDLVIEIIQNMDDTDNAAVISDLVDALLVIPSDVSTRLVEKAARWAESPYLLVPQKLGQLIAHWANGKRTEEALRVARVLLDVFPDEYQLQAVPNEEFRFPLDLRARYDTRYYEEILKKDFPQLVRAAGLPALELLCDLLDKAIRLSRQRDGIEATEDYSFIWRPVIEEHPQNISRTIETVLVTAVRDAAEVIVQFGYGTVEEVVKALERRQWKVFQRLALHLLRVFREQAAGLAAERLTNRALFEDRSVQHEYVLLLRECFPKLTPEEQATILGWIETGPDTEKFKRSREIQTGSPPSDDEVIQYREIWQRDWLTRMGVEHLPTKWQERHRELVDKYGASKYVEFLVYNEGVWVGPTSPKSADELKAMSVEEIAQFLRTWMPPDDLFRVSSPEGLNRVLSSVVAEDPSRFAAKAPLFQGLDPTYVRALLSGLQDALIQGKTFEWEPVLNLCNWVLSQPREIPGRQVRDLDADPDWERTREGIANLLSAGFKDRPGAIPIGLRQMVWGILKPLMDDPEPTPEYEQHYGGSNMDPATLSINTTRGEAMHAVIRYALWVQRHLEKEPSSEERLRKGFDEMPEVREVLETHLDLARESSLAIRAVYGQWFPWLVLLDPEWARENSVRIFPHDAENEVFFEAAWNTYVTFCPPYDSVLEILRQQYSLAVGRISTQREDTRWLANPDEKLAEHLMAFYWRGKLSLDDPLLTGFWKKAPGALRAHALEFIGRALEQTREPIPAEILDRLKELWEQRLTIAKTTEQSSEFEKELAVFGWWFVSEKFELDWAIAQLLASLYIARTILPEDEVLECLGRAAKTHPQKSVECLRLIAEGDREGWKLYLGLEHVRTILGLALQHPDAKDEAVRMIHYLGSRGFLDFHDLLEQ